MFAFPLGLEARTRDFPWMTTAILVVTCVYSVLNMSLTHNVSKHYVNDEAWLNRLQKQKVLALAACDNAGFDRRECGFLGDVLQPQVRESRVSLVGRMATEASRRKSGLSPARARALIKYVVDAERWRHPAHAVTAMPEYPAFRDALRAEEASLAPYLREQKLFAKASFSWIALLKAQFLHADWMHLLGNMAFFLIFAIPLEQRIGSAMLAALYFAGGSAGLLFQVAMYSSPLTYIIGASANVSTIFGAFMILFWSHSIRVWVSLFFAVNHEVLVRTWVYVPVFFVLGDLTGAIGPDSGVGHMAHLGGFAAGAAVAWQVFRKLDVPEPFVYPFEVELFSAARAAKDPEKKLALLRELMIFNPRNTTVMFAAWEQISMLPEREWAELPKPAKSFARHHFESVFNEKAAKGTEDLTAFLESLQGRAWPWPELVKKESIPFLMRHALPLVKGGLREKAEAVRLLDILLSADPKGANAATLQVMKANLERDVLREEIVVDVVKESA